MRRVPTLILAIALAACTGAWAEPYIAVRSGFKCSQCHINQTGGGKRTDYGYVYSQYKLLMKSPLSEKQAVSFDPKLNGAVSMGANFRVHQSRTLDYKWTPDIAQQAMGLDTVDLRSRDDARVNEANLYLQMDLVQDYLTLYLDQSLSPSTSNREFWGMLRLPGRGFFKFGNMLLPYGYRLMDDASFVRAETGFTYGRSGLGYELGFEPGPLSAVVNVTPTTLSSVGSLVFDHWPVIRTVRVGGSYATALKKLERDKDNAYGVFGGFSMGMFTVLGERDWVRKDTVDKIADYVEVDFLPVQGLNFKGVFEYLWPNRDVPLANNGVRRITLGIEPFVFQFLQLGIYYRQLDGPPQLGNRNQDEILGRLHAFF